MKTKLFLIAAVISVCIIIISSCKKKDDESKTDILCNKNWKLTAETYTPTGLPAQDIYASLPSCFTDNLTNFATNGTYTEDEGATKCSASDPQTKTDSWFWSASETVLNILDAGDTINFTITTINGSTVKGNTADATGVYESTYTKQ